MRKTFKLDFGERRIEFNRKAHNRMGRKYSQMHTEIFNAVEQKRLYDCVIESKGAINTPDLVKRALDFGCGTGNVTAHLLEAGFHVVGMDISERFLDIVLERFRESGEFEALLANGEDLSNLGSNSFDLIVAYSVLHHIPDYIKIVREFARIAKSGGIIVLDHEVNEGFWKKSELYERYLKLSTPAGRSGIHSRLTMSSLIGRFNRVFRPRHQPEGDIHVWPDDHIEWPLIREVLAHEGCRIVKEEDYLLYRAGVSLDDYIELAAQCNDMKVLTARKT